ncbi:MAG: calcium/sodium antiporter [Bacteroidales bacterium]|nr:calcium/sodium antiporter [Bacteroidales bacterium]MBN2820780.1 calcium/sodium antiporter [Bacteroidales bacterium]
MGTYSIYTYLLFLAGFLILIKGADLLIKGGVGVAKRFGLSEHFIGLTIVSFGTSMPEFIVSFIAALNGNNQIAVGNVLGSNIANTLLITGVCALLIAVPVKKSTLRFEIPLSIVSVLLLGLFSYINFFGKYVDSIVAWEGFVLLVVFFYFIRRSFKDSREEEKDFKKDKQTKIVPFVILVVLGVAGLFFGGKWIVGSSVIIAGHFGISQTFIGLTVVAFGTSLPELVTSVIAALKKNNGIAIGNIIGSNIFNILWIIGFTSFIKPIGINSLNYSDMLIVALSAILIIVFVIANKSRTLHKSGGIVLAGSYLLYIVYLLNRENIVSW